MQTKIVLNPAYKGPIVIEEYLRKMKSKSGLGRMISNFNKRLFIIDFRHMRFYYLPERGAQLSSATDIPFESITRVYIDNQLQMLDDDQIWKHGFVILSGKRSYRLISYSRNNMENILYALGHLINTATGKPLFDWNEYKQIQDSNPTRGTEPVRPMIFSPPGEEKEKEIEAQAQAVEKPKSRTGSDEIKGEVRKESLKKAPEDPENGKEVRASNTERQEAEEFQERPDRRIEQEREEESRREEKAKAYRMRDEEKNEERVKEKKMMRSEVENADVCESRIVTGEESVAEQRENKVKRFEAEEREEPKERKVGSVRAKVEVLTIDSGENVIPIGRSNASYSVKNNPQAGRDNNMWEQKSITPKNPYGGRPLAKAKRSSEEEIGSNRVNEVEEERNQANRNYMQQNEQEQVEGFGKPKEKNAWGAEESQPKKVEVTNVKKNVVEDDDWDKDMESPLKKSTKKAEVKVNGWGNEAPAKKEAAGYDNWDQPKNRSVPSHVKDNMVKKVQDDDDDWDKDMESPPKKNSKKVEVKVNGWGNEAPAKKEAAGYDDWDQPKNRSVPSHVKESVVKKVQADDDWDNDMFDGGNKSKRLDVRSEYKNSTQNSNYSAVGGFGKAPQTVEYAAPKQTEVPAARGKVHNDWDDDL